MGGMEKVVQEFLAESFENLDQLDQDFVRLEKDPSDREVFSRIFRTIHTIKGTCGFLAFHTLENVTHAGENVLSHLRGGNLDLRPEITDVLLRLIDAVRTILRNIEASGAEGDADYADIVEALTQFDQEGAAKKEKKKTKRRKPRPAKLVKEKGPEPAAEQRAAEEPIEEHPPPPAPPEATDEVAAAAAVAQQATVEAPVPAAAEPETPDGANASIDVPMTGSIAESSIRVDVGVLDHFMNLVGELVLARNQILQYATTASDGTVVAASQRLNTVTGELQEVVMKTRMQPISSIWNKVPRFVRDLSHSFGKEVEVEMEGQDTELDKSIIEAIKTSILHLVRNAVDHGIEMPGDRKKAGKRRAGRLALRADHEGGYILIEVSDDGRGVDRNRIIAKAVDAGLIAAETASYLTERQVENLIFRAGFSTASVVTNVSGRGVGLDVVRANIESVGGSIELKSEPGLSTTFRIKIPLTLAIIPVMIVKAVGERYAIPQASVVELVRLQGEDGELGIEHLHGVPVYRLRGHLLPLVFLNRELRMDVAEENLTESSVSIVVLHADDRDFGLVVDSIADSQEIVVKPLSRILKGLPFAGATILGDGRVSLILDIVRLGMAAGVVSEHRDRAAVEAEEAGTEGEEKRMRLLYIGGPDDERLAIDFSLISRLEFLPQSRVERVGSHDMIQYRGEILQLIHLTQALPERRKQPRNPQATDAVSGDAMQVVVCSIKDRRVGLVVHRILDIVDQRIEVTRPRSRAGIEACIVVRDRVTELIDVPAIVAMADPEFFQRANETTQVG